MIQSCVPLATNVVTLFFVEVTPLILVSDDDVPREQELPSLTAPLVKRHLQLRTFRSIRGKHDFHFRWEKSVQDDSKHKAESSGVESDSRAVLPSCGSFVSTEHQDGSNRPGWAALGRGKQAIPVVYIPSDSPTDLEPCPCLVVGYGYLPHTSTAAPDSLEATVSEATLLRVLPVEYAVPVGTAFGHSQTKLSLDSMLSWKESLLGELSDHPLSDSFQEEVLSNHSKETVNALTLRMRMLLSNDVCIGSSFNSIQEQQKGRQRRGRLQDAMNHYRRAKQGDATATIPCTSKQGDSAFLALADKRSLLSEGGLVVHSPHHGAGKTLLVKTIALRNLKCDSVHVIRPGAMLAKYGVNTDSGLETLLHSICMSAACRGQSICIILDHLDAMMPPKFSGRHGAGDAAVPILNATASYLKSLSRSLRKHKFLFPSKNQLYSVTGSRGMSLSLRICLIGIATCSDDGGIAKNADTSAASKESVLDILGGGRFRVPDLSAQCRFRAFESAFQRANLVLSEGARTRLLILAANALSARGKSFERVARKLTALVGADSVIEPIHLERAMAVLKDDSPQASAVEFVPQLSCANEVNKDHFLTVGGNVEAKAALEEALALDPSKRALLGRFGMAPPTGVLLYGPPGTGKTLLAKAVAKLLNEGVNVGSIGGTFISLQAGDLVRSEVGHSEKLLVSSFDTARSNAPSVVFIDEFQALFAERSMSGGGKLASSLLQCMDDINKWKDADAKAHSIAGHAGNLRVVVMGATNVPWMVDKAFLRPGRFDRVVHVGLPTLEERKMILKVHVSRMRLLCCADKASQVDCICNELASSCDGWSGADLAGLCRAAAVRCLADCGETGEVSREHFLHARKYDVTRSSDDALVERLLAWKT